VSLQSAHWCVILHVRPFFPIDGAQNFVMRVSSKSPLLALAKAVMADVVDVIETTGSTLFDNILTACLYLGAAFQLICIFSVIILPERDDQTVDDAVSCEMY